MGLNGICTLRFSRKAQGSPIVVRVLDIELNRIISCVRIDLGDAPFNDNYPYGYGGVSLVAVEYLTLRNNWIQKNGRSFVDPICGLYVHAGAGLIVEQNEITDNGPWSNAQKLPTPGPRGGIFIEQARTPVIKLEGSTDATIANLPSFPHDGFPALRASDNVVISPVGQALHVVARGSISVQDNQLTSQGVLIRNAVTPGGAGSADPLAILGGAVVRIINLGVSSEVVDAFAGFQNMTNTQPAVGTRASAPSRVNTSAALAALVGGNVLFNDNQVLLALKGPDDTRVISSITILSGDDVSKQGNQCDCRLNGQPLNANGIIFGWSVRVADNRYKEHMDMNGVSAFTLGFMNSTTDNQGTRCFLILGLPQLTVDGPNRSLIDSANQEICQRIKNAVGGNM
jgi:uncharacterized Zn-binding protein involved in type VI secretion